MAEIFQKILDSEQVFKENGVKIQEKLEKIDALEKQIKQKSCHIIQCSRNTLEIQSFVNHQKEQKRLLVTKYEKLESKITETTAGNTKLSSQLDLIEQEYRNLRDSFTIHLNTKSKSIVNNTDGLKAINTALFSEFSSKKAVLEKLSHKNTEQKRALECKKNKQKDIVSKINKVKDTVHSQEIHASSLMKRKMSSCINSSQTHHLSQLRQNISLYESEIPNLASQISAKKNYLNTNFININPLVSPAGGFNQRHDRMFQMGSKMGNRNVVQERFVVPASRPRPVLAMVPGPPQVSGPSCVTDSNEDDDLFDDDDQLICTQVLKVCEEEERKMKRRS